MFTLYALMGLVAAALFIYLLLALLKPELFP
jgi:K+-transporting ATPase KdpF subunit